MNKIIILFLALAVFSCNSKQELTPNQENVVESGGDVVAKAIKKLESSGLYAQKVGTVNSRYDVCAPTLEGNCFPLNYHDTIPVPGANNRPSCDVIVDYTVILCTENSVITSVTIMDLSTDITFCPALVQYWEGLNATDRQESVSSFEFQVSLIVELSIMDVIVNITTSCDEDKFVQAQYVKNLCYTYCWRGKPYWDYVKSTCGYLCCTRKTKYCRNSDDSLNQGNPSYVIEDDGSCERTTECIRGDGGDPRMECTQNKCFYEVRPNDGSDQ